MHSNIVIILLSVAILFATGVLALGVGKIIYGIAHYYLRERKPISKIQHPQLGWLTSAETDCNLWSGEAVVAGRKIPFLIYGKVTEPDKQRVAQLQSILSQFDRIEHQAAEFIRGKEPEIRNSKLDFCLLDVTARKSTGDFTFEFVESGNDSLIWRVEFVDGEPKQTGCDH